MTRTRITGIAAALAAVTLVGCSAPATRSRPTIPASQAAPPAVTVPSTTAPATLQIAPASWQLPAPLSRETVLPDGNGGLLVVGGRNAAKQSTAQVLHVDLTSGTVTALQPLPGPLHDAAGAAVNGTPVAFGGGAHEQGSSAVLAVSATQPARTIGHLPEARSDLAATTSNGTVYVAGDFDGAKITPTVLATTDGTTMHEVAQLPVPVRYPAVAAAANEVVVFGGTTAVGNDTDAVQVLDTATSTIAVAGRLPAPLSHATAFTLNGNIYVAGGSQAGVPSAQVWHYDPAGGTVTGAGTLPAALTDTGAAVAGNKVYLVGGETPAPQRTVTAISTP